MRKLSIKVLLHLTLTIVLFIALVIVSILYGIEYGRRKSGEGASYYENKCLAFSLENANYSKGQIIFIGDSITDGYPLDSYYGDLNLKTYNRGIGVDRTSGVYRRLKVSLYDLKPTKVILMIGINDINSGETNDEIIANYTDIIKDIKMNLPETELICLSVLPVNEVIEQYGVNLKKATESIIDLNTRIKTLVESEGIKYVDLFSNFADENNHLITSYSNDGLHPNNAGYEVWTSILKPILNN